MIRVAIVDDEEGVLNYLKDKVIQTSSELSMDIKIETFLNGTDLLRRNHENEFQIILLDLEMPEIDGLHLARLLRDEFQDTALIFITNRSDLVFQSFEFEIIGFVRKSHLDEELKPTMDRAYQKILSRMTNYVLKTENGERIFPSDSICYFISNKHKVYLSDASGKLTRVSTTLERLV